MKKIELGQALGILANVGVIAGILLLVYELNLNRQMIEAQTRSVVAQDLTNLLLTIGTDEQSAGVFIRGNADMELSEAESGQYFLLVQSAISYFENVHYQYRIGLYNESEFDGQRTAWRRIFASKGFSDIWCRTRQERSPEFAEEIEGLLTTHKCE